MSDVLLYTYPQKDGKYRLKNTLAVASMKVDPRRGDPRGGGGTTLRLSSMPAVEKSQGLLVTAGFCCRSPGRVG